MGGPFFKSEMGGLQAYNRRRRGVSVAYQGLMV